MIKTTTLRSSERGAVLLLCLVMLLALTVIGVSSMSNSTMQERIVGGARDNNMAFQAAEAALQFGIESGVTHLQTVSNFNRFVDVINCTAVPDTSWRAPADLAAAPTRPDCTFQNYYAEYIEDLRGGSEAFNPPPPICIEKGEAAGSGGLSTCQPGSPVGMLVKVDANGYGSNATRIRLRSVYLALKEDIN